MDHWMARQDRQGGKWETGIKKWKSTIRRFNKLKRLRKLGGGPRVFYAGIRPHAMFGAELIYRGRQYWSRLRGMASSVGNVLPIGIST